MMTEAQIKNWFCYHAKTPETSPLYAAIRAGEADVLGGLGVVDACVDEPPGAAYDNINALCLRFAVCIDANAPDSADKTAAIRCVRLARNAANEAVTLGGGDRARLFAIARSEIQKARWQAMSAVACGGL